MKIDLDKIEATARAATPGEWCWDDSDGSFGSLQDDRSHHVTVAFAAPVGHENSCIEISDEDAAHIAQCSPDVVLALVARIRELEAEVSAGRSAIERLLRLAEEMIPGRIK